MPVTIEAAGSHAFDLGHIRRQGGEELLRLLLEKAGLQLNMPWRLQVQKKINCNGETPPVRVVDEPKKWAVHLKIKPGDNDSCHYCSLLMPNGLSGQTVYYLLGNASAELDRNWRNKAVEPSNGTHADRAAELFPNDLPGKEPLAVLRGSPAAPEPSPAQGEAASFETQLSAPVPADPLVEASEPATPRSGRVRGWLNESDKTRLLLLAIHEINQGGTYFQDQWVELLCQRMGWGGANRHEVGGVLTSLVRKDLIERRFRGSKPFGYLLSAEGSRLIADLVPDASAQPRSVSLSSGAPLTAPPPAPVPSPPPPAPRTVNDPSGLIRSFGPIAKQFLEANARLEEIGRREEELTAELDLLREERERICRLIEDSQIQSILANLTRLVQAKG